MIITLTTFDFFTGSTAPSPKTERNILLVPVIITAFLFLVIISITFIVVAVLWNMKSRTYRPRKAEARSNLRHNTGILNTYHTCCT